MADGGNIIKSSNSLFEEDTNEFIKQAMKLYVTEKTRNKIKEHMKQGYLEMSQINVALSELGLAQDIRELRIYETKLTGCEK